MFNFYYRSFVVEIDNFRAFLRFTAANSAGERRSAEAAQRVGRCGIFRIEEGITKNDLQHNRMNSPLFVVNSGF